MGKQFSDVNCRFGAPMGRSDSPLGCTGVRVFRVNLDSGGYDDGGAYWGHGQPLYCATCAEDGRVFIRADSRLAAVAELGIEARSMKKPPRAAFARLCALEARWTLSARAVVLRQKLQELGF